MDAVYLPPRNSAVFTEEDATPQGPRRGRLFPSFAEASQPGPSGAQQNHDTTPHHPRLYGAATLASHGPRAPVQRTASPLVKTSGLGTPLPTRESQSVVKRQHVASLRGPEPASGPSMQAPARSHLQRQSQTAWPDSAGLVVGSADNQGPALDSTQVQAPCMAPARSSTTFRFPKRSDSPDATQQWASPVLNQHQHQQQQPQPQSSQGHTGANHVQSSQTDRAPDHERRQAAASNPAETGVVTQSAQPVRPPWMLTVSAACLFTDHVIVSLTCAKGITGQQHAWPPFLLLPMPEKGAVSRDAYLSAAKFNSLSRL